jgi:ABC-type nitrate/sulfonate/bicarbonate transport system ATPase subunit
MSSWVLQPLIKFASPQSLARAAYSSAEILLLDDVLSGLDSITAQHVLHHLLGPDGLLHRQRRTVVFASSSRKSSAAT